MTLNIKKTRKEGECASKRCKREWASWIRYRGDRIQLCVEHLGVLQRSIPISEPAEQAEPAEPVEPAEPAGTDQASVLAIVEPIRTKAESNATALSAVVITSQGMFDKVGELLKQTKKDYKDLEEQRTAVTKPLLDAKRRIDGWFNPAKKALKELETVLKISASAYITLQEQAKLEALQLGNHEEALAVEPVVMPAGMSTRTTWKFNITDASKIPREYLAIDTARIQAHVTLNKSQSSIPGIEAYPDTGIAARASS